MMGSICLLLGIFSALVAKQLGLSAQITGVAPLLTVAIFWLLIPLFDHLWYYVKFPKAFSGRNTWVGKWNSSKHSGAGGKLVVNFPEDYNNDGSFTADALLYNSIKASKHPGSFKQVRIKGITESTATEGLAMIITSPDEDNCEVTYNAFVANEFKQIAGEYKDLNDAGTFWLRESPFTI